MGTSKSGPSLKNPEDFSLLTGSHSDLCICIRGPIHLSSYLSNIIFCHFPFPLLLLSYSALPRQTMPFKFPAISSPCNSLYFFSLESSYSSFKAPPKRPLPGKHGQITIFFTRQHISPIPWVHRAMSNLTWPWAPSEKGQRWLHC